MVESREDSFLRLYTTQQREKFRVEIRKSKNESFFNGKRFQNVNFDLNCEFQTLSKENKDLPSLKVFIQKYYSYF